MPGAIFAVRVKGLGTWHLLESVWGETALKEGQNPRGISVHRARMSTVASCGGLLVPWGQHGNIIPVPHQIVSAGIRVISQRLPVRPILPLAACALGFSKAPGLDLPLGCGIFWVQSIPCTEERVWEKALAAAALGRCCKRSGPPRVLGHSAGWAALARRRKRLRLLCLKMLRDIRSPRTAAVCIIPLMLPPTCSSFPLAFNERRRQ